MVLITYHDLERAAPEVEFHGRPFADSVPVEADPVADAALVAGAEANPFFTVERDEAPVAVEPAKPAKGK